MKQSQKKADLSLQTVAVAAIVMVVILVVIAVFKGGVDKIFPTVSKANDCEPKNKCVKSGDCIGGQEVYGLGCEKKTDAKYCCIRRENG